MVVKYYISLVCNGQFHYFHVYCVSILPLSLRFSDWIFGIVLVVWHIFGIVLVVWHIFGTVLVVWHIFGTVLVVWHILAVLVFVSHFIAIKIHII